MYVLSLHHVAMNADQEQSICQGLCWCQPSSIVHVCLPPSVHAAQVPEFRASKFKVTNGEFAAFVRSGGYQTRKWWSEEGWGWRTFRNVKWPTFWVLGE